MQSGRPTRSPTPADEALDLALMSGIIVLTIMSSWLIWSGFDSPLAIISILGFSVLGLLVGIPHVTALWLQRDVDVLLGTREGDHSR